jgi:protein TonB
MPVYASTPAFAEQRRHPKLLLLIVAGHAALIAAVMSAKMELPQRIFDPPIVVEPIPIPEPPPPEPQPQPDTRPQPRDSVIEQPPQIVRTPVLDVPPVDSRPTPIPPVDIPIGPRVDPTPQPQPQPLPEPVRVGPRFATPAHLVEPPYPDEKRRLDEEAALRLRLSIDPRGRVVLVEPVGSTDPVFLAAARRHILARWRYRPATEDGRAVASSTVVTLRFQLED